MKNHSETVRLFNEVHSERRTTNKLHVEIGEKNLKNTLNVKDDPLLGRPLNAFSQENHVHVVYRVLVERNWSISISV